METKFVAWLFSCFEMVSDEDQGLKRFQDYACKDQTLWLVYGYERLVPFVNRG